MSTVMAVENNTDDAPPKIAGREKIISVLDGV